ncbi:MAG TPA: NAD(P)H-dependent oxidoreductase [Bryobacteraceae bacterium]|nr:NAD(P)H-dependent oxidoreductase [Bryobacteraceae bacterium]
MNAQPRVLVFAGSTRSGSLNRKLARAAAAALERHGLAVTLADLRDYPMPLYDGDLEASAGMPESARAFKSLVRTHDALAIASPEYNGSFAALLKNAIDWATRPEPGEPRLAAFQGKKAVIMAASPSPHGGQRGLRHVRELLEMIHVETLPAQLTVGSAAQAFDTEGALVRAEDRAALDRLAEDLAGALDAGRFAAA